MHPKPIFRREANLLLDGLVYFRCELRDRSAGPVKALGKNHAPARWSRRVNCSGDHRRAGALGEHARQGRSGREPSEKGRPKPVIACVLIGQHADTATGSQQINYRLKSIVAVEQFQARLAAGSAHMLVNETIAESLIDTGVSHEPDELRHQLRK